MPSSPGTHEISDGFRACAVEPPAPATEATSQDNDACDSTHPCETGTCYTVTLAPGGQCTPGGADLLNQCLSDECSADADCPDDGFCAPRGVAGTRTLPGFPLRHCLPAACRANANCTAKPGGVCGLVREACTPASVAVWGYSSARLACIYPDGCTQNDDCPEEHYCAVVDGAAVCLPA